MAILEQEEIVKGYRRNLVDLAKGDTIDVDQIAGMARLVRESEIMLDGMLMIKKAAKTGA